jgi:hypothetical protein
VKACGPVISNAYGWSLFKKQTSQKLAPQEFICRPCWTACQRTSLKPKSLQGHRYRSYECGVIVKDVNDKFVAEICRRIALFPEYEEIMETRRMTLILDRLEGKK